MRTSWWIVIAVVLIVLGGVAVLLVQYLGGPLRQVSGRTCIGCVTWHWNGHSSIRARRYTGELRFREEVPYTIRFAGGEVRVQGERLPPGCHEDRAPAGASLELEGTERLRLEAPSEPGRCAAFAGD